MDSDVTELTLLSVRGDAQRLADPDQGLLSATARSTADSKQGAMAAVTGELSAVIAGLTELGGRALTAGADRAALTWSSHSVHTEEQHRFDPTPHQNVPTGRHEAFVEIQVRVRDFALLPQVVAALTTRDNVDMHWVMWSADHDNPAWTLVRADAVQAALRRGRDYAAALGGAVVRVHQLADSGLLDADNHRAPGARAAAALSYGAESGGGSDALSLDPVPQVLHATVEARLGATAAPPPFE